MGQGLHNDDRLLQNLHRLRSRAEAIHRMNDARCELVLHRTFQLLQPCFGLAMRRNDVRSNAMSLFQEPKVGLILQVRSEAS